MADQSPLAATLGELDTWVIEQSPAALCVCRAPHGEIIRYNALAIRLWGRTPGPGERLTGAWRTRSADGRLMPADESAMEVVLRGGAAVRDRHVLIERQDGSTVTVTAYVSPLQDDAGRLVGAISAFEEVDLAGADAAADVPALQRALAEREQWHTDAEKALHGVLGSALIGVWDYDLRTRRAVRSITHDQIHGYPQALEEWTFDTFLDHVAPEHRDRIDASFRQCVATGEGEFDCRIIRPDASSAWIWSRGRVVRDADGEPVRMVGIVMDVTRHKAREQTLNLQRRRMDTFVSTLAHELRQPLSALLAAVEVIRVAPDSAPARRATDVMKRQIAQMNRVVEDLMDATRWAQGKVTLRMRRLDLRDVISDAVLDVSAAVAERGHTLEVSPAAEGLWIEGDAQRLHQVLSNLLRNAVKYSATGGRIALASSVDDGAVVLRIRDTGAGIDPDALPHIFDLYAQVEPMDSTGLGIGLSIVREIVSLHGGRIEARSEGLGCGSEFVIRLPLAARPADAEERLSREGRC